MTYELWGMRQFHAAYDATYTDSLILTKDYAIKEWSISEYKSLHALIHIYLVDFNECGVANGGCHGNATCTNIPGSRTCKCKRGYLGDGINACHGKSWGNSCFKKRFIVALLFFRISKPNSYLFLLIVLIITYKNRIFLLSILQICMMHKPDLWINLKSLGGGF